MLIAIIIYLSSRLHALLDYLYVTQVKLTYHLKPIAVWLSVKENQDKFILYSLLFVMSAGIFQIILLRLRERSLRYLVNYLDYKVEYLKQSNKLRKNSIINLYEKIKKIDVKVNRALLNKND
jgi:hypothetical protein